MAAVLASLVRFLEDQHSLKPHSTESRDCSLVAGPGEILPVGRVPQVRLVREGLSYEADLRMGNKNKKRAPSRSCRLPLRCSPDGISAVEGDVYLGR